MSSARTAHECAAHFEPSYPPESKRRAGLSNLESRTYPWTLPSGRMLENVEDRIIVSVLCGDPATEREMFHHTTPGIGRACPCLRIFVTVATVVRHILLL